MSDLNYKLSLNQERLAYRRAVQETLTAFFDKSPPEAAKLVDDWWKRMGTGQVYTSGVFMHDPPLNTAADLAKSPTIPSIRVVGQAYADIIKRAMPKRRKRIDRHTLTR